MDSHSLPMQDYLYKHSLENKDSCLFVQKSVSCKKFYFNYPLVKSQPKNERKLFKPGRD